MAKTFNCGIGAVLIVDHSLANQIVEQLSTGGETAAVIGSVEKQTGLPVYTNKFFSPFSCSTFIYKVIFLYFYLVCFSFKKIFLVNLLLLCKIFSVVCWIILLQFEVLFISRSSHNKILFNLFNIFSIKIILSVHCHV
jgi:hypothetical protein